MQNRYHLQQYFDCHTDGHRCTRSHYPMLHKTLPKYIVPESPKGEPKRDIRQSKIEVLGELLFNDVEMLGKYK